MPVKIAEQRKALAGALAGFCASLANYALAGGSVEAIVADATGLLQVAIATAAGYILTYWIPNSPDATQATSKKR